MAAIRSAAAISMPSSDIAPHSIPPSRGMLPMPRLLVSITSFRINGLTLPALRVAA